MKTKIKELLAEISRETSCLSFHIYDHPKLQKIVKMGDDAVPILLEHLAQYKKMRGADGRERLEYAPWYIIIALTQITEANPIKPEHAGRLSNIVDDWLRWKPGDIDKNGSLTYWPSDKE